MQSFKEYHKERSNIQEGYGVDSHNPEISQGVSSILDDEGTSKKARMIDYLHKSPFTKFSDEDNPEDFIKVEPLNKTEELPVFTVREKEQLPSFEGSTINYGLEFNTSKDVAKIPSLAPMEQAIEEKKKEGQEIGEALKKSKLRFYLNSDNSYPKAEQKLKIIKDLQKDFRDRDKQWPISRFEHLANMINGKFQEENLKPESEAKIIKYLENWREWVKSTDESGLMRPPAYRKRIKNIENELCNMYEKLVERKKTTVHAIQQAFMKKLKHPNPDDKKLQEHFIKLTADNYIRLKKDVHYDYIVYPQSSSGFNEELAYELASHYNATPVNAISKITQPKVDTTSLYWSKLSDTERKERNLYPALHTPKAGESKGAELERLKAQLPQDAVQGDGNKAAGQVKNVKFGGFRPFIKNLELNRDAMGSAEEKEGVGFKGNSILFIDDNISSSGTIQRSIQISINLDKSTFTNHLLQNANELLA